MRRKIGTTLDATIYQRAKETARRQGRGVNEVIEEALARFLAVEASTASIVAKTKGSFRVSEQALRAALSNDFYGAD
jgi:hypothetical protein